MCTSCNKIQIDSTFNGCRFYFWYNNGDMLLILFLVTYLLIALAICFMCNTLLVFLPVFLVSSFQLSFWPPSSPGHA